ncbi:MAG: hypothetical protein U1C74_30610, partial [Phenylobacterium sp.]|nr:hypothetical protein [Phenylobacterium sp.]
QAAQGFTQQQALAAQAFFEGGGGGAGPGGTIGNIGTGLGAIGQFLNAPLLTFGTDIGAAALGGAEAAFGGVGAGIGVSALGILAAGLGGVGLGATLFPQGGIGPMIGGGIGGIGGFIGGAALGGALGIASTAALAVILPGVGAILGAVAGSFLGSLFGGSDSAKNVARSQRANQIAQGVAGQIETWARGHAVLGPPLLAVAQYAIGVQTTGRTSSRNQLNVAAGLRSLFSGRVPSDAEVLGFLRSFGPATILTRGLGMSPPSGSLDEIQRLERIALSGTDFLDIGGALFVEEGARLGIPGVEPFITAGLLPQSIESAEVVRLDGIQRLRIKQRQIEAIHQMSPEVAEAFLRKLVKELERLGIPHGNLVEAFQ